MPWNQPNNNPKKAMPQKKLNRTVVTIVLGVVIVALVGWLMIPRHGIEQKEVPRENKKIQTVKPAKSTKSYKVTKQPTKPVLEKKRNPKKETTRRVGEIKDGYVLLPSGELYEVKGVVTSQVASTSIADKTFKYNAERQVAHLLMVEPGEGMLGDGESLYSNFNKEFKESLKEEITFDEKDTQEQRELKEAMIDIRTELIDRMNKGEDLSKVMIETRKQLQELALYKDELNNRIEELKKDGNLSKQDRLDLLEAANEMLKERGIQPFLIPSSLQRLVDLRESQKNHQN